jgi:carbamoyl-phosphate synthase / aspartate carbamoyltransferase / dihydroorotase
MNIQMDTLNENMICLTLENGEKFYGNSFGASIPNTGNIGGEVVFTTGMVGYTESLSDPSYRNQLLVFTYPLIGNYGVPNSLVDKGTLLPFYYESNRVQAKAVIVNEYSDYLLDNEKKKEANDNNFEHWKQQTTLGEWLKMHNVTGICGVDTRRLTETLREKGTMKGIISIKDYVVSNDDFLKTSIDSSKIVNEVSCTSVQIFNDKNDENQERVVVIDCGLKYNQLRLLIERNVCVIVVPWNYNINNDDIGRIDRLFISNGPGDPEDCKDLIQNLCTFMERNPYTPIFGICLGHQLLALASGAKTYKLKYGNRGHNIPCKLVGTERCYITSQNHGFAVDENTLIGDFKPLFINMNDDSNEGIYNENHPWFSVQFHPEAKAGPEDTVALFDAFLELPKGQKVEVFKIIKQKLNVQDSADTSTIKKYEKVLVLGSGGLCIGQSGEFDYSGSQAIKAYKEENMKVVLVNPNIATVQTSPDFVDKVYFLPITPGYIEKIIIQERPDCIALSFGGQSALNCGSELYESGVLEKYNVDVLGTSVESIMKTEDRDVFKRHIKSLNESIPDGAIATNIEDAVKSAEGIGYPVLVRAAYALGGLGSGFANNREELIDLLQLAFANSSQVIIDKSLKGWKEIEYEIVRDRHGNCISVCNMENIDPLGIHTGESIVVAPSQTLDDAEYNMLRSVSLKVVNSLNIVGECNIQYALDPFSDQYYIIEMNARLSRSSALASKATGYPLAYVAAKLSLGYSLSELKNSMTKTTSAFFEPSLDYCVVKIPRWDLEKFELVTNKIDSAMKSVGEGMAIARSFEEAFQKALRMTGLSTFGFEPNVVECNEDILRNPTYKRILAIATGLYNNSFGDNTLLTIRKYSNIDMWFLKKFKNIIDMYHLLEDYDVNGSNILSGNVEEDVNEDNTVYSKYYMDTDIDASILLKAKKLGFSDKQIAECRKSTELVVREKRRNCQIYPVVRRIDTVAGEFPCSTNYLYTTYKDSQIEQSTKIAPTGQKNDKERIIVLGSGVYKIGSSVEFDWCAVSCIRELTHLGKEVIMINCNPETVSTDYDEADKLYFDELSFERVMDIYEMEDSTDRVEGVVVSVGGQIPNNIAMELFHQHVPIKGTSPKMIDMAENRHHFSRTLDKINVDQPLWRQLTSLEDAIEFCGIVGYPCLVRPSYVLSGAAMNVAFSDEDLRKYLAQAVAVNKDHPVVISKFIDDAKEIEVDAVADNGIVKLMAISEHVENAGVHSGDATLILPAQDLTEKTIEMITRSSHSIAKELQIHGPFNIQFIAKDDQVKVIECNLRVSRSFPFVSKILGVNFVEIATKIMCHADYNMTKLNPKDHIIGVKAAQFSFNRLKGADILLDVEMKSTGEVACFGNTKYEAFLKAVTATGFVVPKQGSNVLLSIGTYKFKNEFLSAAQQLVDLGFKVYCTHNTSEFLRSHQNIENTELRLYSKNENENNTIFKYIQQKKFSLIINISERNKIRSEEDKETDGYKLRRLSTENSIPIITDIKYAKLLISSLNWLYTESKGDIKVRPEVDCFTKHKVVRLPGLIDVHVHVREPGDEHKEDWETCTKAAISGGITTILAMPNTKPAIVDENAFELVSKLAADKSYCDYGIYLGASNHNTTTIKELSSKAAGLKMYLNHTFGDLLLSNMGIWTEHVRNWPDDKVICVHAEGQTLAGILHIASLFDKKVHVCHVSKKEEIELIKLSKDKGQKVTCEVSPHHLFLVEGSVYECLGKDGYEAVKPPLSEKQDVDALWENMNCIDCFATDHAPHMSDEKTCCSNSCPGYPGLETALALLLTAVREGKLTLNDIIEKYHTNPRKIFNISVRNETYVDIDMDEELVIPMKSKYSKCDWNPFAGKKVYGAVKRVVLGGKLVYVDGTIVSEGPMGKNVIKPHKQDICNVHENLVEVPLISNNPFSTSITNETIVQYDWDAVHKLRKKLKLHHVLSASQFDRETLSLIFDLSDIFKKLVEQGTTIDLLKGKSMATIFYEPSTRTRCSFTSAMQKLGGNVIHIASEGSSVQKGETIEDFVRCMECYSDVIVLRSSETESAKRVSKVLNKPLINAGDGSGEHPTQALLDMYTIREEMGTTGGNICVTMYGDLKYGRTVHSLCKLLALRPKDVRLKFVSPTCLSMPIDVKQYLEERGVEYSEHRNITDVIDITDVLYVTRIQKERLSDEEKDIQIVNITPQLLHMSKKTLRIMHPLPRVGEISTEIDSDPRAAYFRQMQYGLYVRMALISLVVND